jgi:hypothetical protein
MKKLKYAVPQFLCGFFGFSLAFGAIVNIATGAMKIKDGITIFMLVITALLIFGFVWNTVKRSKYKKEHPELFLRNAAPINSLETTPRAPSPKELQKLEKQKQKELAKKFAVTRTIGYRLRVDDNNRLISMFGEKRGSFLGVGTVIIHFQDIDDYNVIRRSTSQTKGKTISRAVVGGVVAGVAGAAVGAASGLETKNSDFIAIDIRLKDGTYCNVDILNSTQATNLGVMQCERQVSEIQRFLDEVIAENRANQAN